MVMDRKPARSTAAGGLGSLGQVASVLVLLAAVTGYVQLRGKEGSPPPPVVEAKSEPVAQVVDLAAAAHDSTPAETTEPALAPAPSPAAPQLDTAAVARAGASLDAASRDRARAEARLSDLERRLAAATNQAALDAASARKLAFRIRDPSAQISRVSARGGFIKSDLVTLKGELQALRTAQRPKATSILTKSPVARPASGDEFHFELRRNRISFINLDRLMELAKADAQVRIRMTDRSGLITSQVGPVGAFSLAYVLGRSTSGIDELIERQSIRFDLKGWELVPEADQRGYTYEASRNPISEYARAVNRLTPGRSVVTFWVYPDSFPLYRRLREELVARGFAVAGRPLPEGMLIRGSPMGSVSAAQ
jgi:hypothetical protein